MLDDVLSLMNRIQDTLAKIKVQSMLDLPQIAVVGAQSAGKSSVLESIVGLDFLPRGSGIMTRMPLIIQLQQIKEDEQSYGEFLHVPDKKFYSNLEIKAEIQSFTNEIAGAGKQISATEIRLKYYSPQVVNLTLVDLPGLTKNPVAGQPISIVKDIRNLVLKYIEKPNTLILAVSPANVDIANSDALEIARQVDENLQRTVGVLTKVDIMDQGTDIMDVINGEQYRLEYGYTAVKCRSQHDIECNKPIEEALEEEAEFFRRHSKYSSIANKSGIRALAQNLQSILIEHIQRSLPQLRKIVQQKYDDIFQKKSMLSGLAADFEKSPAEISLAVARGFEQELMNILNGSKLSTESDVLQGGALVFYILRYKFQSALEKLKPSVCSADDLAFVIMNSSGYKGHVQFTYELFEDLIKQQIDVFEETCINFAQIILQQLRRFADQIQLNSFKAYSKLRPIVSSHFENFISERFEKTVEEIKELIENEKALVNFQLNDVEFKGVDIDPDNDFYFFEAYTQYQTYKESSKKKYQMIQNAIQVQQPQQKPPLNGMPQQAFVNPSQPQMFGQQLNFTQKQRRPISQIISEAANEDANQFEQVRVLFNSDDVNNNKLGQIAALESIINYFKKTRKVLQKSVPKVIVKNMIVRLRNRLFDYITIQMLKEAEKYPNIFAKNAKLVQEIERNKKEYQAIIEIKREFDRIETNQALG